MGSEKNVVLAHLMILGTCKEINLNQHVTAHLRTLNRGDL